MMQSLCLPIRTHILRDSDATSFSANQNTYITWLFPFITNQTPIARGVFPILTNQNTQRKILSANPYTLSPFLSINQNTPLPREHLFPSKFYQSQLAFLKACMPLTNHNRLFLGRVVLADQSERSWCRRLASACVAMTVISWFLVRTDQSVFASQCLLLISRYCYLPPTASF